MSFNSGRFTGLVVLLICFGVFMTPSENGISIFSKVFVLLLGLVLLCALSFGEWDFEGDDEVIKPEFKSYEIWVPDFTSETILKWNDNEADVTLARDEFGALYLGFQFKKLEGRQFWLYTKLNEGQQELLNLHKLPFGETFRNAPAGFVWLDEVNYDNTRSFFTTKILTDSLTSEMLPVDELI